MNEYKINTKSEIQYLEEEKQEIHNSLVIDIIILIIFAIYVIYTSIVAVDRELKIRELNNTIEQQYYVIDALESEEERCLS